MSRNSITITHSVFINASPEKVWDFTQDYSKRASWDNTVLEAKVLQTDPHREVWLKLKGNSEMTFVYKLDDRPNKTSLVAKDVKSSFITGGGGSWRYEPRDEGTLWTQTNTLVLKPSFGIKLFLFLIRFTMSRQMKIAMLKAKEIMEKRKVGKELNNVN